MTDVVRADRFDDPSEPGATAPGEPSSVSGRPAWVRQHLASLTFGIAALLAVPVIFRQGRDQWFFLDEWVFIVDRDLSVGGLLRPHNEHWTAVPVLIYRVLFRAVGIRSYFPYQAVVVAMHLAAALMLRVVMRRAGVSSWVATIVAGSFLVFGSGRQNIVWAFQMSFTGSLCFGLAHLLLADHRGAVSRRDLLGLALGLVGLACSGVGIVMVAAVGLATFLRRGWRPAAFQVVPLAAIWSAWWLVYGRDGLGATAGLGSAWTYGRSGLVNAVSKLSPVFGAGFVLVLTLAVGLGLIVRREGLAPSVRRLALPLSLAVAAMLFLAMTGVGRAERQGNDVPEATRYVHLIAAWLLPLVAVAIDEFVRRWKLVGAALLLVVAAGVPANVAALRPQGLEVYTLGSPRTVAVAARLPILREMPPGTHPFTLFEGPITAGWLLGAVAAGRVADAPVTSADERAGVALEIAVQAGPSAGPSGACQPLVGPESRVLEAGRTLRFVGAGVRVVLRYEGGASPPVTFRSPEEATLQALAGPLDLTISPLGRGPVALCG